MNEFEVYLKFAERLAQTAGARIAAARSQATLKVSYKERGDLVTETDLEVERLIIEELKQRYPTHSIISEETNSSAAATQLAGSCWIIDPIDGTTNFAHGHVHVAVSIAYVEGSITRCGVVHAPFLGETFTAVQGGGAFCNGQAIRTSDTAELAMSLIATGFPYGRGTATLPAERVRRILANCRDLRRNGAATLDICGVACGRLGGYYESIKIWDFAAAALIAEEAGAQRGSLSPTPDDFPLPPQFRGEDFLVASPKIYGQLKRLLED